MRATDSGMVRQQRPSFWDEAGRRATEAGGARLREMKNSSRRGELGSSAVLHQSNGSYTTQSTQRRQFKWLDR